MCARFVIDDESCLGLSRFRLFRQRTEFYPERNFLHNTHQFKIHSNLSYLFSCISKDSKVLVQCFNARHLYAMCKRTFNTHAQPCDQQQTSFAANIPPPQPLKGGWATGHFCYFLLHNTYLLRNSSILTKSIFNVF